MSIIQFTDGRICLMIERRFNRMSTYINNEISKDIYNKYERQVDEEIATAFYFHDVMLQSKLGNMYIDGRVSMLETTQSTIDASQKMRFIYLLSIFEAFATEFIRRQSGITDNKIRPVFSHVQSYWNSNVDEATSLVNINFVGRIFKDVYEIDILSGLKNVTKEAGYLRNITVHHSSEIVSEHFLKSLDGTLSDCGLEKKIGTKVPVTSEILNVMLQDFRIIFKRIIGK